MLFTWVKKAKKNFWLITDCCKQYLQSYNSASHQHIPLTQFLGLFAVWFYMSVFAVEAIYVALYIPSLIICLQTILMGIKTLYDAKQIHAK